MTREKLKRISELTAISRRRELTAQEKKERELLRRMYLEEVRENLRSQLEQIALTE